jgi:hypothetical protein
MCGSGYEMLVAHFQTDSDPDPDPVLFFCVFVSFFMLFTYRYLRYIYISLQR